MPPILREQSNVGSQLVVERFVGEGAFAQVYRVRHRVLGRQAMKVFKQPLEAGTDVGALLSEAVLLSRIGHPNIVRVFDAGTLESGGENHGYFTMEYVGAGTLHDLWRSQGAVFMDVITAVNLVKQAAFGLSVAHLSDPPIIHRDIKPTNILAAITPDGYQAKISDFGLARQVNPITLMATAAGTLPFKAPEVFSVEKSDSPAADVWSLGVTLYLLLTDQMPYLVPNDSPPTRRHFENTPYPPSSINPDANGALDKIIMRTLAVDPANRFPTAVAVFEELERWKPDPLKQENASNNETAFNSSQSLKSIEVPIATAARDRAQALVASAMKHVREGALNVAADSMEEAIVADPTLRATYEPRVRLWRMGVAM